jgi:hypothetical protein
VRADAGAFSTVGVGSDAPARGMPAIGDLGDLMMAYLEFMQADAKDKDKFLRELGHVKIGLPFKQFAREPSDLITFSELHEIVRKIIHVLMVGHLYGANEDIGMTVILDAFEGDATSSIRTALDDARPSDDARFRLHDALCALLTAYLPPKVAKEWCDMRLAFVWNDAFVRSWAKATRLYDLHEVTAAITGGDTLHVKLLEKVSWVDFLQMLEDTAPAWVLAILSGPTARDVMMMMSFICPCRNKNQPKVIYPKGTSQHTRLFRGLLAAADPGVPAISGTLAVLSMSVMKCYTCVH